MKKNTFGIEDILMMDISESVTEQVTQIITFADEPHTLTEFSAFFQWLGGRLDEGSIEFNNLIFEQFRLNKSSSKLLSLWILRMLR